MRLRTFKLPARVIGEVTVTPFVMVADCTSRMEASAIRLHFTESRLKAVGADDVWIFQDEIDLG